MKDIVNLIIELAEKKIDIYLQDGKLKLDFPEGDVSDSIILKVKSNKHKIIDYLSTHVGREVFSNIPLSEVSSDYELSSSQRRLWVLSQFDEGNSAYNVPAVHQFEGALDLSGLSHAFSALIERHEILRTVFRSTESGDIRQVVLSASESGFKISEYDFRNAVNQDDVVHEQVVKDIRATFDLGQGPLLRAGVYRLGADRWVFTYVMHHIISDGWSMEILIKELLAYYNAYVSGSALELPGLRIQYKDYAAWQRGSLSGSLLSEHQSYWREQLSGRLPVLELATDRPRPAVKTYHGGEVQVVFAQSVLSGLRSLVQAAGATVFMGLLAGVNAFLYRYSGQDDLIVGSPIAGRNHSDLEDQIGFYVNTLALRHRIAEGDSYRSLLEQVREVTLGAYAHQVYPFDELVNDLRLPVDRSRNPLFDVLVALQSSSAAALEKDRNAPDHLKISSYELGTDSHVSKFELSFNFMADDDDLHLNIAYNSDLYDRETIIRMGGHLNALLSEIIVSPEAPLSTLCYLSTAEREQLLSGFNATEATYPADQTLVSLFREQVLLDADAIAVVYQDIALSYGELESSSNRLAAYLISTYGIVSEELIGIKLERSEWMIIAILGILKSGGAYVPIDPAYPQERIDYISKDSNCRVIIDAQLLADFMPLSAGWSEAAPEVEVSPSALAYVIYTSGSTGTPKGSLVTHHNVVRLFRTDQPLFDFGRSDVWTMFHSYCFDFSVWEMYGALLNGGKLVVVSSEVSKDPLSFLEVLRNHQVTVLNQTPSSFYNLMKEELDAVTNDLGLRYVIFGGESLSPSRLGLWLDRYPDTSLINMYGITETTVHVTYKKLTRSDILNNSHNIGRPIPTLSCYVLDSLQQLLPIGVPGELYVGGEGVCRGYLNREELTKLRFLNDLLKDGERVYRTGDKARMLANGEIEYLGRQDDQVKVRGYRIELGEIESALSGYPGLLSSVVLTRSGSSGDQELIAYVVSDATLSSQELRTYLSGKLPSYMIPGYYVQPSSLPLTSNGKIDRKALPNPEGLGVASGVAYVAPRNDTEEKLAEIWSEILDIPKARIGIYDSFFDLGGHSLKVIQLSSQIYKVFNVKANFQELFGKTVLFAQAELIVFAERGSYSAIQLVDLSSEYVLSSSQRRLWILNQFGDGNVAYNMPGVYLFEGMLDMAGLSHAFSALIERHEILRTVFRNNESDDICQVILSTEELGFSITETDMQEVADQQEQVQELIAKDFSGTFDLALGPLLRAGVYRLEADRWIFTYVMHHIISDGWSMEILIKELLAYYNAYVHGSELVLPALRIQYKDYSAWQQKELNGALLCQHRSYWQQQLSGVVPILNLATDRPRPLIKTYNGGQVHVAFDREAVSGLSVLVQSAGVTLFMGVLAAVNALLYRYSGQEDLIVGSPIAGRNHSDLEDQIGFYVNTLALRSHIGEGESYRSLLEQTREITLGAYEHQVYPFDELVNDLRLPVDRSRNPLFDVMVELQHVQSSEETENDMGGLKVSNYDCDVSTLSKFDLRFVFHTGGTSGLSLLIEYNSDLYDRDTITRMGSHLSLLLSEMVDSPEAPISTLSYLSAAEREQLLSDFNATDAPYPADQTLVSLFKEQVLLRPSAIAVVYQEKALSYAEVDAASNRLAHYLLSAHVIGKDALIGIRLERSEWMILVILGILKSGGAYVPIDPEYPQDRVDYIVGDSGCVLVIDSEWLSEFLLEGASFSEDEVIVERKASDLAYVIYTSGSTGLPKGVMVEHGGVINRIDWMWRYYGFSSSLVVLQKTSYTFDVSVGEIFMPLCWGAKMILCSGGDVAVPERILRLITEHGVSYVHFVAGMLNSFMSWAFEQEDVALRLSSLTALVTSGEALSLDTVQKWYRKLSVPIYNLYGPTEASIEVTHYEPLAADQLVPIGKPISNIQIYIVERHGDLSPVGVAGEICIAGVGVARGYLNRPELSAEKFVPNPYQRAEEKLQGLNERMYLTGDQGRWLSNGNIEFLGRKDDQVKIRGYRIEPGEIENALQGYPGMVSAVVVARKGASAEQELIAYVVSGSVLVIQELRAYLGSKLPAYMVPSHYVQLDSLPLNASGKTDRKALPDPEGLGMASGVAYVAPRTETEEKLVEIWSELLEVPQERIGIDDDFLNLGGHSLKMIRLSSQIYKTFGVKTGLQDLFSKTTLCAQAELIGLANKGVFTSIAVVEKQRDYPLSLSQQRLWILSLLNQSNIAYNVPGVYLFEGSLDLGGLSHAFSSLIERHEILRTVFRSTESGDIRQVVLSASESGFKISECDFTAAADQDDVVHEQVAKDIRAAFDLGQGPLLRAGVYRLSANRWVFSYVMHHIISDGWSMEILIKELLAYYNAYLSGSVPELPGLRIQYKDYAAWQRGVLSGSLLSEHRSYWQQELSGTLPVLELSGDRPRPAVKTYNGGQVQVTFDESVLSGLRSLMQSEGTTLFMGLLAGVNALLYRYSGQDDLIVGSPIAGRSHLDLEDQIGFYVNTLVLRSRIGEGESYRSLLEQTRKVALGAYDHQDYPFDELVNALNLPVDRSRNPLFDVQVILNNEGPNPYMKAHAPESLLISKYQGSGVFKSIFDLVFNFSATDRELQLTIDYNSDIYDRERIVRMGSHLSSLLSEMMVSPDAPFSGLDYLSVAEREQLLYGFNATDVSYPVDQTLVSLFREQVLLDPDAIAVVYRERELSYGALDAQSDRLAHYLVSSHGIGADVLVGLLVERSDWMIIAILGILKSGGAYVPIDPAYPKDRIRYMVEDAGIGLLLTQTDYMFELDYYQGALFAVDVQLSGLDEVSGGLLPCRASDLAYVIYTSGSTGRPKGVMIGHGAIVNTVYAQQSVFGAQHGDRHLQFASISFDACVSEIFVCLSSGGSLYVVEEEVKQSPLSFQDYVKRHGIDICTLPPVYVSQLDLGDLGGIRSLITAGESAVVSTANEFLSYGNYLNAYGPTEVSICASVFRMEQGGHVDALTVPVGKPISNTRIYITGRDGGLSGVGIAGEICISGAGLARGYLNRAELSAEKFVPNPYQLAEEKERGINERMYLTGDQGRWLEDGNIEFLGRKDDQVKIRGYRIELGEIEVVLQGYPDMVSAVVIARKGVSADQELIAYLVSGSVLVIQELRAYLGSKLPAYMVPSHYVQLDSLPLNASGKTDRKALPDPEGMGMASGVAYVAPRTEIEEKLAAIWSEVLNTPKARIGIHDSFFDLGGDSIKSIQIVSRLKQQGYSLTIQEVLLYPVIGTLSKYVSVVVRDIDQQPVVGLTGLSPIQRMFFEDYGSTPVHYNQSVLLRSSSRLSLKALRLALDKLVEHHDALRMVYYQQEGTWLQENKEVSQAYGFEEVEQELDEAGFALFCDHVQGSADLSSGPLFRAVLFRGSDGSDRLLLVSHHLVIDGVSWRIIFEDLSSLYEQFLAEQVVQLPLKTDSFRHWQSVQEEYSRSAVLLAEQAYWSLSEDWPLADLQADQAGGSNLYGEGTSESFSLDRSMTSLLLNRCYQSYHTEINDILVSGLVLSLAGVFGIDHIRIGMEGHGREDIGSGLDVTRTVGWFTTTYPVCIDLGYAADRIRQLIEVKECLHRVPNKGIGYGILRYLGGAGYQCRPSVTFNYLGDFGSGAGSSKEQDGAVSPSASLFSFSGDYHGREISGGLPRQSLLDVSGMIVDGCLQLSVVYSAEQYSTGRMRSLISRYQQELEGLILELSASTTVQLSPVDLSYQGLSVEQVHSLNADALLEDVYRLGPLQEGLYYHWLSAPDSSAYFMQISCRLHGRIDIDLLSESYRQLVGRHGVLRTSFVRDYGDVPLQVVRKSVGDGFRYHDVAGADDEAIQRYREEDRALGFDLESGSQMRLMVLCVGPEAYELIWSHHHIIMDGWCSSILIREIFQIYYSLIQGKVAELGEAVGYSKYINWLGRVDQGSSLGYWGDLLRGYDTLSSFSAGFSSAVEDQGREKKRIRLSAGNVSRLGALCSRLGVTENTFIQSVWGLLLGKYNDRSDVVFGAVVSGRPADLDGVEDMIGLFSNTVPVRIRVSPGMTFTDLLAAVQQESIAGSHYHYTQLAEVQQQSELGSGLFDHVLVFENYPVQQMVEQGAGDGEGLRFESVSVSEQTNYGLTVTIMPGEEMELIVDYDPCYYEHSRMERMEGHLLQLIDQVLDFPEDDLSSLSCLSAAEREQLLYGFNATDVSYPVDQTLVSLFREQVLLDPDAIAVVYRERELSYGALDAASDRLAHYLVSSHGIGADVLVGLLVERSDWMIIAILGILKSGGAYVPIDPAYPKDRIRYMVEDAGIGLLLTQTDYMFELDYYQGALFAVDVQLSGLDEVSGGLLPCRASDLAYVIYTSGSTGRPKGVMIGHGAIVNTVYAQQSVFGAQHGDRHLQFASISFDACVSEIFVCLSSGGSLYVVEEEVKQSPLSFQDYVKRHGIDICTLPPVYVSQLDLGDLGGIRSLITAGERAVVSTANEFLSYGHYLNAYGPTEVSICASVFRVEQGGHVDALTVPVGKPISNTRIYITGRDGGLSGVGIAGEICISGAGLARGYLNRAELSAEKFVPNPYQLAEEKERGINERMYLTGDQGRWLEDGNIEFLGRKDDQVKIRGYRIEPGEIEGVLQGYPDMVSAVVIARKGVSADQELIAYVVSGSVLVIQELRAYLGSKLPAYMVPSHYVQLDSLPLNASGKTDRKALPDPEGLGMASGVAYVAPRTEIEAKLAAIWSEVLNVPQERIGIHDSFFDLGGHSLKVIQLMSKIKKHFEVNHSMDILFKKPTIEDIADEIEKINWVNTDESEMEEINNIEKFNI
ncbi:amino acid adenylation domain-containing protein [Pedobacter sp. FW305-3-2-15-E-R2A2]|uniref:amino acid adenylation domain-containing protein n=1 Tax=Pedobacter sp. FW305-3-2-15-E-R2A2 TaxID=3140251 RepID=UPI00313FE6FA